MTPDEIMALEGRELRKAVAIALGWVEGDGERGDMPWYPPGSKPGRSGGVLSLPRWDEDIAAAWQVVERMHQLGVNMWAGYGPDGQSFAAYNDGDMCNPTVDGETIPEAICRAALLAALRRAEEAAEGERQGP